MRLYLSEGSLMEITWLGNGDTEVNIICPPETYYSFEEKMKDKQAIVQEALSVLRQKGIIGGDNKKQAVKLNTRKEPQALVQKYKRTANGKYIWNPATEETPDAPPATTYRITPLPLIPNKASILETAQKEQGEVQGSKNQKFDVQDLVPTDTLSIWMKEEEANNKPELKPKAHKSKGGKVVTDIGYGHVLHTGGVTKEDIIKYEKYSPQDAENDRENDLRDAAKTVSEFVKIKLTKNQFDALSDFVYNSGRHSFINSKLLSDINNGITAPDIIKADFFNFAADAPNRKTDEANIYNYGTYEVTRGDSKKAKNEKSKVKGKHNRK
jgi:GH24 family phage-related lysozyme (muramidase)